MNDTDWRTESKDRSIPHGAWVGILLLVLIGTPIVYGLGMLLGLILRALV